MQIIQRPPALPGRPSAAGAAGLVGAATPAVAEPPPETGRIRLSKNSGVCLAPQYVAEDLLYAEGFTMWSMSIPSLALG